MADAKRTATAAEDSEAKKLQQRRHKGGQINMFAKTAPSPAAATPKPKMSSNADFKKLLFSK